MDAIPSDCCTIVIIADGTLSIDCYTGVDADVVVPFEIDDVKHYLGSASS